MINGSITRSTLYKIAWSVTDSLYGCNIDSNPAIRPITLASNVLNTEHKLMEWQASLPAPLGLIEAKEILSISDNRFTLSQRLRVILTLRFHNLQILTHRPHLDQCLDAIGKSKAQGSGGLPAMQQVGWHSNMTCFQAASSVISLVSCITHAPEPMRRLLGAWWFTLYYSVC